MGRARNRRGQGAHLRTEILAAATGLLDRGEDLALRAVARAAGIATPSIYPHFPDGTAILNAVIDAAHADLMSRLRVAVAGDPAQSLRAGCQAYLDFAAAHPRRYRVLFDSGVSGCAEFFGDVLADCVGAGCSTSADPAEDAIALWLGLHGLAHQRAVHSSAFPWPAGLVPDLITALAHLAPPRDRPSYPQPR